jgi:anti-sigma regulatory factor (Ser/Thr protein kinase)
VPGFPSGRPAPERAIESERVFAPRVDSIAGARRFIVDALRAWPLPYLEAASAALVVSELATNAIVHADSQFGVNVRRTRAGVRITVSDTGSSAAALTVQRTHGLGIVSALAERWGVCATAEGKAIWAELPIQSRVTPA